LNFTNTQFIEVSDVIKYFKTDENKRLFLNSLNDCYQNPLEIFSRVSKINNNIFVLKNNENKAIKGYLFFCDKENAHFDFNDLLTKQIYNGYALINEPYRQTGALKELLLYATNFYIKKYNQKFKQLLFYAVTSNPIALRGYYKIFPTVRPLQNGQISDDDLLIADQLKANLFIEAENNGHPFTFKTNLPQRYVENIRKTFIKSELNELEFLNNLNINEQSGDRFLFYWITNLDNKEF
jgi:hypothetical protein